VVLVPNNCKRNRAAASNRDDVGRQKAKGKRQKAKGKRQKAKGKRQKAKGKKRLQKNCVLSTIIFAFCLLPFNFRLSSSFALACDWVYCLSLRIRLLAFFKAVSRRKSLKLK
jgi:hypothetical protein